MDDLKRVLNLNENCLSLIQDFYKSPSNLYDKNDLFSRCNMKTYDDTISEEFLANRETVNLKGIEPEYEYSNTGQKLKLTPEGRFQLKNGLRKPNIINYYDPDIAAIGEFENKYLVYFFKFVSDNINRKVSFIV